MILTDAGRAFHHHSSQSLKNLENAVRAAQSGPLSVLRIGALPNLAGRFLNDAVKSFIQMNTNHQVILVEAPQGQLHSALAAQELDLVICGACTPHSRQFESEALYDEEIVVVTDPLSKLVALPYVQALAEARFILPCAKDFARVEVDRYLAGLKRTLNATILETSVISTGEVLVQQPEVLWFVSRALVSAQIDQGKLVQLRDKGPIISAPMFLLRKKTNPHGGDISEELDQFRALITKIAHISAPLKLV
jgi:LysR family pca operon transcriptional activator